MIRRLAASLLIVLALLCFVGASLAGFVGVDQVEKAAGTGLTPYSGAGSGSPTRGVWKTWPSTNTAADTTASFSIFCRDARRVTWFVQGTGTATAPCSLLTVYVSNNDSSWIDCTGVGMTVNDYVTGQRLDCATATGCGRPIDVTIGGVERIAYDRMLFVMTRKKGLVGAADSLRIYCRIQQD